MNEISQNIKEINLKIENALKKGKSESVCLVAVTKTVSPKNINIAIENGIFDIGENKAQELLSKIDDIDKRAKIHFIGHLQTNKVKYIIDKVSLIHSVDSINLASEINKRAKSINKIQDILIEVNVSGEQSKFGIAENKVYEFLESLEGYNNIRVLGLMTIAPLSDNSENSRIYFKKLYKLFIDIKAKKYHNIPMEILSMGMSNDFEVAIEEGANLVRIGSAIFGKGN